MLGRTVDHGFTIDHKSIITNHYSAIEPSFNLIDRWFGITYYCWLSLHSYLFPEEEDPNIDVILMVIPIYHDHEPLAINSPILPVHHSPLV